MRSRERSVKRQSAFARSRCRTAPAPAGTRSPARAARSRRCARSRPTPRAAPRAGARAARASASVSAHEQPVTPPPITTTSGRPSRDTRASGSAGSASQYDSAMMSMLVRPVHTSSRDRAAGELELGERRRRARPRRGPVARASSSGARRPVAQPSEHRLGRGAELDRLAVGAGEPEDVEHVLGAASAA